MNRVAVHVGGAPSGPRGVSLKSYPGGMGRDISPNPSHSKLGFQRVATFQFRDEFGCSSAGMLASVVSQFERGGLGGKWK
jgi:hypothetical protein